MRGLDLGQLTSTLACLSAQARNLRSTSFWRCSFPWVHSATMLMPSRPRPRLIGLGGATPPRPGEASSSFGSCGFDLTATAIPSPYVDETRAPLAFIRKEEEELPQPPPPFEDAAVEEAVLARVTRKPIPPTSSSLSRPSTIDPITAGDVGDPRFRFGDSLSVGAGKPAEEVPFPVPAPAPCQTHTNRRSSVSVNRLPVLSSILPRVDRSIRFVIRMVAVDAPSSAALVSDTVDAIVEPAVERCRIKVRSTAAWRLSSEARWGGRGRGGERCGEERVASVWNANGSPRGEAPDDVPDCRTRGGVTARCLREGCDGSEGDRAGLSCLLDGEPVTSRPSSLSKRSSLPALRGVVDVEAGVEGWEAPAALASCATRSRSLLISSSTSFRFWSLRLCARSSSVSCGSWSKRSASCSAFERRSSGDGGRYTLPFSLTRSRAGEEGDVRARGWAEMVRFRGDDGGGVGGVGRVLQTPGPRGQPCSISSPRPGRDSPRTRLDAGPPPLGGRLSTVARARSTLSSSTDRGGRSHRHSSCPDCGSKA